MFRLAGTACETSRCSGTLFNRSFLPCAPSQVLSFFFFFSWWPPRRPRGLNLRAGLLPAIRGSVSPTPSRAKLSRRLRGTLRRPCIRSNRKTRAPSCCSKLGRNEEGRTPAAFKEWLIANTEGYDELTYRPRGRSWFVLSGYRGDNIYYEKVMFSCGGDVVNVFAMSYPVAERSHYDPIVERIEDQFRPGKAC